MKEGRASAVTDGNDSNREMSFHEFWEAIGRRGKEGFARAEWRKLVVADKTAIAEWLRAGQTTNLWAGIWLRDRVWEEPTAKTITKQPIEHSLGDAGDRLRSRLGDDVFASWFSKAKIEEATDKVIALSVPTVFLKNWISTHYGDAVLDCRACISKWIGEKKISSEAIIGEGMHAKIWVQRAEADLASTLTPNQQWGREFPVLAPKPGAEVAPLPPILPWLAPPRAETSIPAGDGGDDFRRRRKADADRAEFEAEAARRRNERDTGRWMDRAGAELAWAEGMQRIVDATEIFILRRIPQFLAEQYGLDHAAVAQRVEQLFEAHLRGNISVPERRHGFEAELASAAE
jgi:hypothetical protein